MWKILVYICSHDDGKPSVFETQCVWVVLLLDRSTGSELNLSRFSHFRDLEKLQLRANNGLTLADGCTDLTNVGGLVHLKTLVSMICLTFFHSHVTDVVATLQRQYTLYLYTWIICGHHPYPVTLYFLKFRECTHNCLLFDSIYGKYFPCGMETLWYGDGADNTIEKNSSVFSLIRMR